MITREIARSNKDILVIESDIARCPEKRKAQLNGNESMITLRRSNLEAEEAIRGVLEENQ